jgi:hypothetical protein
LHWQRFRFNDTTRAEKVEIPPEKMFNMPYVYVKDSEGFVFKKKESEVTTGEKIISEKDYMKKSGLALYKKKFGHGGAR